MSIKQDVQKVLDPVMLPRGYTFSHESVGIWSYVKVVPNSLNEMITLKVMIQTGRGKHLFYDFVLMHRDAV